MGYKSIRQRHLTIRIPVSQPRPVTLTLWPHLMPPTTYQISPQRPSERRRRRIRQRQPCLPIWYLLISQRIRRLFLGAHLAITWPWPDTKYLEMADRSIRLVKHLMVILDYHQRRLILTP